MSTEVREFINAQKPGSTILDSALTQEKSANSIRGRYRSKSYEIIAFLIVASVAIYVHAKGMATYPGYVNEDEGTYLSQAWAVLSGSGSFHGLAPYSYWYDHPPFGWIQIAIMAFFTNAFHHGAIDTLKSGREYMLLYFVADLPLLYFIARKLRFGVLGSLFAILLIGISPLSVTYLRFVFLDSIAITWLLITYAILLSNKRPLLKMFIAGLTFGLTILTKETFALALPGLLIQIWYKSSGRTRKYNVTAFLTTSFAAGSVYLLYAALRGELLAGPNHNSIEESVLWQLFQRPSNGSIFDPSTNKYQSLYAQYALDPLLIKVGLVGGIICLFYRHLRPLSITLLIGIITMIRPGGYVPQMYVEEYIPILVLTTVGGIVYFTRLVSVGFNPARTEVNGIPRSKILFQVTLAIVIFSSFIYFDLPNWLARDRAAMYQNDVAAQLQAERWIIKNIPRSAPLLVDDYIWLDLVLNGFPSTKVVWVWKLGYDPSVNKLYPQGWKNFDYLISTPMTRLANISRGLPYRVGRYQLPFTQSVVIKTFGQGVNIIQVRKIIP